jgi:hypothetical protein
LGLGLHRNLGTRNLPVTGCLTNTAHFSYAFQSLYLTSHLQLKLAL